MMRPLIFAGRVFTTAMLLSGMVANAAASDQTESESAADSAEDNRVVLLFMDKTRPLFLHLHVEVDGKGFRTAWSQYVAKLFNQLDADGDNQLNAEEVQQGPWTQFVAGQFDEYAAKTLTFAWDVQPADGSISQAELSAGLQAIDAALDLRPVQPATAGGPVGNRLLEVLDVNGDERLSPVEIAQAGTRLRKLDLDDDGTMSIDEIRPFQNPFFQQRFPGQDGNDSATASNPFFLLAGRQSIRPLIRELLNRYDTGAGTTAKGDNRLKLEEIGLDPAVFERFDANGNGELTTREIRALLSEPPVDVDLLVRLGKREEGEAGISLVSSAAGDESSGDAFRLIGDASPTLILNNVQIQFAVERLPDGVQQRNNLSRRFEQADGDDNDYLDQEEASRFGFGQYFRAMDRDRDEKVFQEEVTTFLDQQTQAARSRTVLSLRDNGSELFELVDTSGDARLSQRELTTMQTRLSVWDADGDGELASDEAIHNYRVALSRGSVNLFGGGIAVFNPTTGRSRDVEGQGPMWFQKMDRNRDGDVSEREFLGSGDAFGRLDADGDGLIDSGEAAAADG